MKSNFLSVFKSCCQNKENHEISSLYKVYQILFVTKIIKKPLIEF